MVIRNIAGDQNPYANEKIEANKVKESQQQQTQATAKDAGSSSDTVALSSEARLRNTALQTANEASDVRRQKVDALKKQVQEGTYQPDLKKAAANLIRDDLDLLV